MSSNCRLGRGKGQVAGHGGGEGGPGEGLAHPVVVGPHALHQIAEALNQHATGQHVGQGRDVLAVAVGLVEGLGKAVGHQQGEIGVLALQGGVGIEWPFTVLMPSTFSATTWP